jgi:hypothetical protein
LFRRVESNSAQGEEVLHLPTIVEAAVASPAAAASAASQIRRFLSKENYNRPHVQYNAVMLIRILADNPGPSFTKNLDKQFADTVKHLLRNGQDPSVSQILKETLDAMEREKAYDTNLNTIFAMWKKEKGLMANAAKQFGSRTLQAPPWNGQQQFGSSGGGGGGGGRATSRTLPPPVELASRIEEARTSAKLLLQLVQSTPPHELLGNDLVKEFSERCIAAQRSIQGYIGCDNPPPDDDTMLTLIETNEQLSLAASKHQRAVLQARRAVQGPSPSPPVPPSQNTYVPPAPVPAASYSPPTQPSSRNEAPMLPPVDVGSREQSHNPSSYKKDELPLPPSLQAAPGRQRMSSIPAPTTAPVPAPAPAPDSEPEDNPFADHHSAGYAAPAGVPPPGRGEDVSPVNGYNESSHISGYHSTPSYLGRQESSADNLTMHGGAQQRGLTEEEEYARDYPVSGGPRTPEQAHARKDSDVSPVAERGTVTYRY